MTPEKIKTIEINTKQSKSILKAHRERIDFIVKKSAASKKIELLLEKIGEFNILRIYHKKTRQFYFFAEISQRSKVKVAELNHDENPWDLILQSWATDNDRLSQSMLELATELPAFINSHHQVAKSIPIDIYRSKEDFLFHQPTSKIRFRNNLVILQSV